MRTLVRDDDGRSGELSHSALARNVVTIAEHHTDIFSILPAQFVTADMVPGKVGTWMFHCHIDEHVEAGMMAMYRAQPQ